MANPLDGPWSDPLAEAAAALANLATMTHDGPCWCEYRTGNPMQPTHSERCAKARLAIERIRRETDHLVAGKSQ